MAEKILSVEVKGLDKVLNKMTALGQDVFFELSRALYREAEGTMTEAKQLVPVDTGALRASGYVMLPREIGGMATVSEGTAFAITPSHSGVVTVECGFGGAAAPYALVVHEDQEARHDPPTQYKYLEQPFNQRSRNLDERIGAALKARLA